MNAIRSPALLHPEQIHPALWRGSQLAQARLNTISTGFDRLNQELPSQGWPLGTLIELTLEHPGIGEMGLLRPALARLECGRSIALVRPPYPPHFQCWANWQLDAHPLLWINPKTTYDALWASEQVLKANTCAALLCWASGMRPGALRRLHLAARQSDILFVLLRPQPEAGQASAAPLRLSLRPINQGLEISIIKRHGPSCAHPVPVIFYPMRPKAAAHNPYVSVDQYLFAYTQPRPALST